MLQSFPWSFSCLQVVPFTPKKKAGENSKTHAGQNDDHPEGGMVGIGDVGGVGADVNS